MSHTPSLLKALEPATSKSIFSWHVFGGVALFSSLLHLLGSVELANEYPVFRFFAAAVAVIPMFLAIGIVTLINFSKVTYRVSTMLMAVFVGAGVRGYVLARLLDAQGLVQGGVWQYRVPSSVVLFGTATLVMSYGVETYLRQIKSAAALAVETSQLKEALIRIQNHSADQAIEQLENITQNIVGELEYIQLQPTDKHVDAIQNLLQDQVRPLTRDLAESVSEWKPPVIPTVKKTLPELWKNANPLNYLPSPWIASVVLITIIPSAIYAFGWVEAVQAFFVGVIALQITLRIGVRLMRRTLKGFAGWRREVAITIGFVVISAAATLAITVTLLDSTNPTLYVIPGLVFPPIFSWLVVLTRVLWNETLKQEQQLRLVRTDLAWALARINLLNWFNNGLLARLLHGPIQNSLHASVIRLKDANSQISIEKILEDLRQRILDATSQLSDPASNPHELRLQLQDIGSVWQSICNVTFVLDKNAEIRLHHDLPAAAIMSDLALEVCSNAIRHGGAKNVSLHITSHAREIKLTVEDDGKPREPGKSVGVGSRFVDTCSTSWKYRRAGSKNRLVVGIPSEFEDAVLTS